MRLAHASRGANREPAEWKPTRPVFLFAPRVALLVAQLGHGNPALIRARILQSADDLGEPGVDPYYGKGRVNVARALGLIH